MDQYARASPLQRCHYSNDAECIAPFLLADIGEGITEVQVLQLFVKEGDAIKEFDRIAEVQSDKAAVEITSRYDGKITKIYGQVGSILKVGHPIVDIATKAKDVSAASQAPETLPAHRASSSCSSQAASAPPTIVPQATLATPAVRSLAKDLKLALDHIQGTGPDGRILRQDLERAVSAGGSFPPAPAPKAPLSIFQRSMVKSMQASLQIPHFGYSEDILVDTLLALRSEIKLHLSTSCSAGQPCPPFTLMSLWIKAASMALSEFPILNASILSEPDGSLALHYHATHNIGFAMDSPQGLTVPVIKDVQRKSLLALASELAMLIAKGKEGTLSKEDLSAGTFTLSNIGAIGSGISAIPILPVPQVCIGAVCRIQRRLIVAAVDHEQGQEPGAGSGPEPELEPAQSLSIPGLLAAESVRVASVMRVNWSADHRIVDGATMARFSARWKFLLENPSLLMQHLK